MAVTLAELASHVQGCVRGDAQQRIYSVAALDAAGPHDIAYVADKKYLSRLSSTAAGAVLLTDEDAVGYTGNALIVADPQRCFAAIAQLLHPPAAVPAGVHPSAVISERARIAASAWIGPHVVIEAGASIAPSAFIGPSCYVGADARIGERTRLVARVTVLHECTVGADGVLHPGVVIGADGFGFAQDEGRWVKMPQRGGVVIGDDVEIGANTTVDRGTLADTVIGDGVKLDNLIQIGHNVRIGDHTVVAACCGVAGSAVIGRRCLIGGQCGIVGHIEIADDVKIMATSLITKSITQTGSVYSSSIRAEPLGQWRRNAARISQLDDMAHRLRQLEAKFQQRIEEQKS